MEQGSLPERYLSRSVIKHVRKQNKALTVSAAIGNDYSCMENVVTADGLGDTPFFAFTKAMNNFACSGGICKGARLLILLPMDAKESHLKTYMAEFNTLAEEKNVQILGGHTEISEALAKPQFSVTLIGEKRNFSQKKKEIKPGYDIVMVGLTGILGTDLILDKYFEELSTRFAKSYLKDAYFGRQLYSICEMAKVASEIDLDDVKIFYMHDVSKGGVYGALWQLGVWMDKGFLIEHRKINICQETIEICEYYNVNPYLLEGTGALLLITNQGERVVKRYQNKGFLASVIGKVTEGKEKKIVMNEVDRRCLSPVNGDEIFHIKK